MRSRVHKQYQEAQTDLVRAMENVRRVQELMSTVLAEVVNEATHSASGD